MLGNSLTCESTQVFSRKATLFITVKQGNNERIGRLMQMHANKREELQAVYAGDIARQQSV